MRNRNRPTHNAYLIYNKCSSTNNRAAQRMHVVSNLAFACKTSMPKQYHRKDAEKNNQAIQADVHSAPCSGQWAIGSPPTYRFFNASQLQAFFPTDNSSGLYAPPTYSSRTHHTNVVLAANFVPRPRQFLRKGHDSVRVGDPPSQQSTWNLTFQAVLETFFSLLKGPVRLHVLFGRVHPPCTLRMGLWLSLKWRSGRPFRWLQKGPLEALVMDLETKRFPRKPREAPKAL